jgi:hypothetical protein
MTSTDFQALTPDQRGQLADYRATFEAHLNATGAMRQSLRAKMKRRYAKLLDLGLTADQVDNYMSGAQTTPASHVTNGTTGLPVRIPSSTTQQEENTTMSATLVEQTPSEPVQTETVEKVQPEFARVSDFVEYLVAQAQAQDTKAADVTEDLVAEWGSDKVAASAVKGYGPNTKRAFPNPTFVKDVQRGLRKAEKASQPVEAPQAPEPEQAVSDGSDA